MDAQDMANIRRTLQIIDHDLSPVRKSAFDSACNVSSCAWAMAAAMLEQVIRGLQHVE